MIAPFSQMNSLYLLKKSAYCVTLALSLRPNPRFRQNLEVNTFPFRSQGLIDRLPNLLFMQGLGIFSTSPLSAVEIPEIHTLGQFLAPLPLEILAHFRFDLIGKAGRLVITRLQGEKFLHARLVADHDRNV